MHFRPFNWERKSYDLYKRGSSKQCLARGPRPLLSTCKFWRIVHDLELWKARLFKFFLRPSLSDYPTRGLQRPRPRPLGTMLTMILDASACAAPLRATSSKRKLQRCCARLYYLHEAMKCDEACSCIFHILPLRTTYYAWKSTMICSHWGLDQTPLIDLHGRIWPDSM